MSYRVVFSPAASDDLENLFIYLASEIGPRKARDYVGEIKAYCLGFSTFPQRACCVMTSGLIFALSDIGGRRQ